MSDQSNISLEARLENIARLQAFVRTFCSDNAVDGEVAHSFTLAFEELMANVVNHGQVGDRRHRVDITLSLRDGSLVGSFMDDGAPFNPLNAPMPNLSARIEDRRVGGLGLHLIREMMDDVSYARETDRNHLVMSRVIGVASRD